MKYNQGFVGGIVTLAIVAFILLIFLMPFISIKYETSKGEHTGYITAVERNGLIWKTGRAFIKTDAQSSQEDMYCVIDDAVFNQLTELSKKKAHVTIKFVDYFNKAVYECDGENAVVYEVIETK